MDTALALLEEAIAAQKELLSSYEHPSEVLTFETVRALDTLFCRELFSADDQSETAPSPYPTMSWGTNHALSRIVPDALESGSFRLFRSTETFQSQANDFLFHCGCLHKAEQLSGWLREGLLDAEVRKISLPSSPRTEFAVVLRLANSSLYTELMGRRGLRWRSDFVVAMDRSKESELERRHMEMLPALVRAVDIYEDWSIGYVSTDEVDNYFLEWGQLYLRRMFGQDILGTEDVIGGRPFNEYLGTLAALSGRAQKHLCFAAILQRRHPHLSLQNLLTTFSPFDEFVVGLARHLDSDTLHIQRLLSHLTLAPDNKRLHLSTSETSWAPLIRASNESLILPVFGLDINPFLFLLRDLRAKYPGDWSEAANRREKRWVEELRHLFPAPRWQVGANATLRRGRQTVTDVDFWALDTTDNRAALFQLKWQHPVGIDNRTRRSAGKNLLSEGNRWIDKVTEWIEENGMPGLSGCLSLKGATVTETKLFVVARYNAWFAGFGAHGRSAVWSDWNHVMKARLEHPSAGVLEFHDALADEVEKARSSVAGESYAMPIHNLAVIMNTRTTKEG